MREIKFRAFISAEYIGEEKGLMFYPNDDEPFLIASDGNSVAVVYDYEDYVKEDDFIIMQYTGLKCSTIEQNELYEDDIIKYSFGGSSYIGRIIFKDGMFIVKDGAFINYLCYCLDIELLGSIYENTDLLDS